MQSGNQQFFSGLSGKTVLVTLLVIGYFVFNNGIPFILNWDLFGHHAYLPMVFSEGTVVAKDLSYFEAIQQQYQNTPSLYQFVALENGNFMIKYTSGWAVLMLPFYCLAELWAMFGNAPRDGFSFPYQAMIAIGAFTYFTLSIFLLRKVLLHFFSDRLSAVLIILLAFGTNLFFMQFAALGMSHNLEFFLITLLLLLTIRFHEKPTAVTGVLLGCTIGMIALVRPPDVLVALLPLGWNYQQYGGFFAKLRFFFKEHRRTIILTVAAIFVTFSPQMIYWKLAAGKFFMNSYANNPGEGFDWFSPYVLEVLFSFKKGWLLYTPIMVFALAGLFVWRRKNSSQGNPALITFLVLFYVISSWSCWWYAESFSQRSMVDLYPLLIIAFGFFLAAIQHWKSRFVFYALIGILFCLNLFQTYQITNGIIDASRMTKAYYFSVFGQTSAPTAAQLSLLSVDRGAQTQKGIKDKTGFRKCFTKTVDFGSYRLANDTIYTPTIDILPSEISSKEYFWTVATWKYEGTLKQLEGKIFTTCTMYKGSAYAWTGTSIADPAFELDTVRKEVTFAYLSPHFRTEKDPIRLGVWKQFGDDITILGVKIEGYEPL